MNDILEEFEPPPKSGKIDKRSQAAHKGQAIARERQNKKPLWRRQLEGARGKKKK